MNAIENWFVSLAGADNLWIVNLFIIVLAALTAGYIRQLGNDARSVGAVKGKADHAISLGSLSLF